MKRAIVTSADLPISALAELKEWLAITTVQDDATLTVLLQASIETCEAFTGIMPIACECEEQAPVGSDWLTLMTRPVQAITSIAALAADGTRTILAPGDYAVELDADGGGMARLSIAGSARRIVIAFTAGLVPAWDALPAGLRHGMIRLAAHQYRQREGNGASPLPPAAVAALWRPWRRVRLT